MGLFDFFKKAAEPAKPEPVSASWAAGVVCAPVSGKAVQLSETSDPVFASEAMGKGIAVEPSGEVAYAPVTGTVSAAMSHAVGITADDGAEVLVHVGIDTVEMAGNGLTCLVSQDAHVEAGQPIVSFSKSKIAAAGKKDTVFTIVTNSDDYAEVAPVADGPVDAGSVVVRLTK